LHTLFTRIFLSFWAAIVLIASGAAALTAFDFAADSGRPATITSQASEVLRRDGLTGLRTWLAERNRRNRSQRTLIVDTNGHDILGQKLPEFRGRRPPGFGPGPPPPFGPGPERPRADGPGPSQGERTDGPRGTPGAGNRGEGGPPPGFDRGPRGSFEGGPPPRGFRGPPGSAIRGADGIIYYVFFDLPPR